MKISDRVQIALFELSLMWQPEEACGFIVSLDGKYYDRAWCLINYADETINNFILGKYDTIGACSRYHLANMAFWHSHPKGRPTPSPEDVELMNQLGGMDMVIVGLHPRPQIVLYGADNKRIVIRERYS